MRHLLSSLIRHAISRVLPFLPAPRVITDQAGTSPLMSRYYLLGRPRMPDGSEPFEHGQVRREALPPRWPVSIYLHHIHRGDDDIELHDHPWPWACSLILTGSYIEERRLGSGVAARLRRPLTFNWIGRNTFHRIDLPDVDGAWTLFITGPKNRSWRFWDRETGELTPWREFITRKRGGEGGQAS